MPREMVLGQVEEAHGQDVAGVLVHRAGALDKE